MFSKEISSSSKYTFSTKMVIWHTWHEEDAIQVNYFLKLGLIKCKETQICQKVNWNKKT